MVTTIDQDSYEQNNSVPPSDRLDLESFMETEENERLLPPVLLQYWHTMLRWRLVLISIIVASLVAGVVVTLLMPRNYTAKTQIEINRQQKKVTNVQSLDATENTQDLEFYATQYALLKSTSLADRISKKLHLVDRPEFFSAEGWKMADSRDDRERDAMKLLLDNVSVEPVKTSRLVDVSYTSRSPQLSMEIANTWAHEFIGATTDREFESTAQAREFLEGRLVGLRQKLEQSEQMAVTYASKNNIISLETQRSESGRTQSGKTLTASDLDLLNTALIAARADRIAAASRAMPGRADVGADVLTNPAIGTMKERRAEVAAEYARVLTQFEPGYPTARALKEQIDELDVSIAKDTNRFTAERKQSYAEALAREKDLERQFNAAKALFDVQNMSTIQYNIFQRDADTNRQLYDGLLQRYKEIAEAGDVGASNIAIVDRALVPILPSSPKLILNLGLALVAGIALASIAVLALEQIDEGIRSPSDIWTLLKLPLLGNVPLIEGDIREELSDSKSILTEAYLSIRSNLAFSTNHGLPRSIAVTSAQPNEGKTTSALAMAEIIGRTGKTVVLVDGDMRNPSIHHMLDLTNTSGLSNLLAGDEDVAVHARETSRRGMSVLTAGPLPPNPAELLSSERISLVIERLLAIYDHVVIDAPPVLGLADAPLICRAVEGSVFVAEPGRSPVRGIRSALQRLKLVGSHIFGVVITKIDNKSNQQYGYNYGYGYGYGYGSSNYGYGYIYRSEKRPEQNT
ncbi:polysaccharide biosynthesis tyrosine autokinase [Novosphingobium sp.]|uniref:GumC family protein n=1 Tax=Novosphingobium sp. TaxID=1874826 RepID=UPI00333EB66D